LFSRDDGGGGGDDDGPSSRQLISLPEGFAGSNAADLDSTLLRIPGRLSPILLAEQGGT
jgi:hypothetical protein